MLIGANDKGFASDAPAGTKPSVAGQPGIDEFRAFRRFASLADGLARVAGQPAQLIEGAPDGGDQLTVCSIADMDVANRK